VTGAVANGRIAEAVLFYAGHRADREPRSIEGLVGSCHFERGIIGLKDGIHTGERGSDSVRGKPEE